MVAHRPFSRLSRHRKGFGMRSCITAVSVDNGCLILVGLKHTCGNHTWISSKLALIRLFPIAVHSPVPSLAPVSSVARPSHRRLDTPRVVLFCSRLHSRAGRMVELTKADTLSLFGGVLPSTNLLKGAQTQQAQSSRDQKTKAGLQERPPKFQKPNNSKGKGKGKSKEKRQREESEPSSEHSLESSLIPLVAQLCLRHEDSINILRMDKAYVMLFKTSGEETMLPTIHDLGVRWSELQAAKQTDCAKRIALIKGVVMELQTRAKALLENEDKVRLLIKMGWITRPEGREPAWLPVIWNVAQQKEVPCPDVGPLPASDAQKALDILLEHASGQIVQRFHPTRKLAEEYAGEIMEFKLEISLKGKEAMMVHEALDQLCNSALWLLVGARMRPEGPKRSAMAKKLQQLLHGKC